MVGLARKCYRQLVGILGVPQLEFIRVWRVACGIFSDVRIGNLSTVLYTTRSVNYVHWLSW